jgi:polyisoprenyl-teichoic acid--peptidoglycan teichoic acid transferase
MDGIIRKPRKKRPVYANKQYLSHPKELLNGNNEISTKSSPEIPTFSKKNIPRKKRKRKFFKKILIFLFLIIIITITVAGIYFFWKINSVSSKISSDSPPISVLSTISKIAKNDRVTLKGENNGRINILLLGVAGKGRAGGNLTDTVMVASIDTVNNKTALLSLPRDFYAAIPDSQYSTKINSIYKYGLSNDQGVEPLKKAVEEITGLSINYYLVASFAGFEKFVDDLNGVIIQVERDIYDPTYPGPNYSYELFALEKGTHLLDGSTTLKYARERHDDPQGDFGRAKRQQQVLQAIKSRIFSTKVLFNPFALNNMLDTLGESITTDISLEEMESLLQLSKELDTQNITNVVVDAWKKDSLLKVSHIFYKNIRAFILVPRVGNYSEIQDLAQNIFNLDELTRRKEEIKKEQASIAIINQSGSTLLSKKIEELLQEKMDFQNIENIKSESRIIINSTEIVDLTHNQKTFTLDELLKKLPATLASNNFLSKFKLDENLAEYDLVVILGSDLIAPYSFEEHSIEEMEQDQNNLDNKEILIKKN